MHFCFLVLWSFNYCYLVNALRVQQYTTQLHRVKNINMYIKQSYKKNGRLKKTNKAKENTLKHIKKKKTRHLHDSYTVLPFCLHFFQCVLMYLDFQFGYFFQHQISNFFSVNFNNRVRYWRIQHHNVFSRSLNCKRISTKPYNVQIYI